jgi:hypothetical protein
MQGLHARLYTRCNVQSHLHYRQRFTAIDQLEKFLFCSQSADATACCKRDKKVIVKHLRKMLQTYSEARRGTLTTGCRNSNARLLTTSSAHVKLSLEKLLIVTKRFWSASFEWLVEEMQFNTCFTPSTPESPKLFASAMRQINKITKFRCVQEIDCRV